MHQSIRRPGVFTWWSASSRKGENCSLGLEESYLNDAKEALYKSVDILIPYEKRNLLSYLP